MSAQSDGSGSVEAPLLTQSSGKTQVEETLSAMAEIKDARQAILREIDKRIIGQRHVIDQLLIALFAKGHCLFVGVPGLAKTLLISTLSEVLSLRF